MILFAREPELGVFRSGGGDAHRGLLPRGWGAERGWAAGPRCAFVSARWSPRFTVGLTAAPPVSCRQETARGAPAVLLLQPPGATRLRRQECHAPRVKRLVATITGRVPNFTWRFRAPPAPPAPPATAQHARERIWIFRLTADAWNVTGSYCTPRQARAPAHQNPPTSSAEKPVSPGREQHKCRTVRYSTICKFCILAPGCCIEHGPRGRPHHHRRDVHPSGSKLCAVPFLASWTRAERRAAVGHAGQAAASCFRNPYRSFKLSDTFIQTPRRLPPARLLQARTVRYNWAAASSAADRSHYPINVRICPTREKETQSGPEHRRGGNNRPKEPLLNRSLSPRLLYRPARSVCANPKLQADCGCTEMATPTRPRGSRPRRCFKPTLLPVECSVCLSVCQSVCHIEQHVWSEWDRLHLPVHNRRTAGC